MKVLDFLSAKAAVLASIAAIILALLGTLDVIMITFFNSPIVGVVEFSSMLLVCVLFLGMAEGVRGGENVSVDILVNALKGRARRALVTFNRVCTLLFFLLLAYLGWKLALDSFAKGDVMAGAINFKLWPFKLLAALGATLALIAVLARLLTRNSSE